MTQEKSSYAERRDGLKQLFNPAFRKGVAFKKDVFQNYASQFNYDSFLLSEKDSEKDKSIEKESETDKRTKSFLKQLGSKTDPDALAIKETLQKTLEAGTGTLNEAQKNYQDYAQKLNTLTTNYSTAALLALRKEGLDKARSQITSNYKRTSENIEKLFDDTSFQEKLKSQGLDATQISNIKTDLSASLKNYHDKLLSDFEKANQEELKKLHQEEQRSVESMLFLRKIYSNGKKEQEEIANLLLARESKDAQTTLSLNEQGCYVSSDDVENLTTINRLGGLFGLKKHSIKKQEDGSYSLEQGKPLCPWNIAYYLFNQNKQQLLNMAQAIRLAGNDSIVVDVKFENDERGKETARRAYEACIEAGFSPDKIVLNYNGQYLANKEGETTVKGEKVKTKSIVEVLYDKKTNYYQYLQQKSPKIIKHLEKEQESYKKVSSKELYQAREAMNEGRQQEREAAIQKSLTPPESSAEQTAASKTL